MQTSTKFITVCKDYSNR